MKSSGLTGVEIAAAVGRNKSTVTRWKNGDNLPPDEFVDAFLNMVEGKIGTPLADEVRERTHSLYRAAFTADEFHDLSLKKVPPIEALRQSNPSVPEAVLQQQRHTLLSVIHSAIRSKLDANAQRGRVNAELSRRYYEIAYLREHLERLRQAGQPTAETEEQLRQTGVRAAQLEEDRRAVSLAVDQAHQMFLSLAERPAEENSDEYRLMRARLRQEVEHPRQPWWPHPPAAAPAGPGFVPAGPPLAPPPPARTSHRLLRVTVGALVAAVVVLAVAVAVIATRSNGADGSGSAAAPTATVTVQPSAPAEGGTAPHTSAPPPSPTDAAADAEGWKVAYQDVKLTLGVSSQCDLWGADFETPSARPVEAPFGTGDLIVQECGLNNIVVVQARGWGKSAAQKPSPDQCLQDVERQGLPSETDSRQLATGTGYCLLTARGSLIWFKVVSNSTSTTGKGIVLQVTRWDST
ncbi:hypothetical protein Kpho02_72710 [Kitasatospora phosalacinea]|uniref:HTH cro/C1-type domain-containing protein n=2 Tax=Kitasatospora phosalacinea TaxID=2065 RepID=A0A9W6V409_9ACTN|nr:hypothetical protein [Kitasatospora phosalacinea]GLW74974.1 hypothetical protein Kpho02_72710 [Kitasatospora phosalacinea]